MNLLTLLTGILLLAACQQREHDKREEYYQQASDRIQDKVYTHPDENLPYIDSLESNGLITPAIADYFRSNTYYGMGKLRVVEYYAKKAIDGGELYKDWPRAYYIACRNLANNLLAKGDDEGALHYATQGYERAVKDPSPSARLFPPGLLVFIAAAQQSIGKGDESRRNFEQSYQQTAALARNDTSFNTNYHFAQNTLSRLIDIKAKESTDEMRLWIERTEEAVRRLHDAAARHPISLGDQQVLMITTAQMYVTKARVLALHGLTKEAAESFRQFMKSDYAKGMSGIISQYNYMTTTEQWDKAAALIPRVDSVRSIRGHTYSLSLLKSLAQQHETYLKAGMPREAQQKSDELLACVDTVVKAQQKSAADELAVIFETQQKETKIKEQETEIVSLRVSIVLSVLVLVIAFLVFFTLQRQKEARKLAREHRKLQKAFQQLTSANERAEESSRMKTAFIQQISHEIRTPLNILSGFAQVIAASSREMDEGTLQDANTRIMENTQRITEIFNKMLELSESSSHAPVERSSQVAVQTLVGKAIKESRIGQATHITFTSEVDDSVANTILTTHEGHAVRALSFLLGNAYKFTSEGTVRLRSQLSPDGRFVEFAVEDAGPGIPAKEAEHIFEEFVQLDVYTEGTGIGLTVARSFARQLGGDVVLDSAYHPGARFVLTLPL